MPCFNLGTIGRPNTQRLETRSELDAYLTDDIRISNGMQNDPLEAWKTVEHLYPSVALMTKDILSIPASGVGVERIFNTARDVCHYRRNRLNPDTIEMIMLVKWYEKLGLWAPEKENIASVSAADVELPMDEQSCSMIKQDVEWETESSDGSIVDI